MVKEGFTISVEADAGTGAGFSDDAFQAAGAIVQANGAEALGVADVVLCVGPPLPEQSCLLRAGALLIGFLQPHRQGELLATLAARGVSALSLERVPRVTRAQGMDALSSQASIAGYKAVLLAAARLDKYFPLLMTAAGTVQPARVVVLGAGVAGLQALATARRLGAVVEVSDVRPEAREQVQSIGGRFIDAPLGESGAGAGGYARELSQDALGRQRATLKERLVAADVIICTALVPGRPAPQLVDAETVRAMRPGSVIVDLAAPEGGNCELTRPGGRSSSPPWGSAAVMPSAPSRWRSARRCAWA